MIELAVACPRCHVPAEVGCRTSSGAEARRSHAQRVELALERAAAELEARAPRELERLVAESVGEAPWLGPWDRAKVALALALARKIDDRIAVLEAAGGQLALDDGQGAPLGIDDTGITYDSNTLAPILDSLGLSPKGRRELRIEEPQTPNDPLAEARRRKLAAGS